MRAAPILLLLVLATTLTGCEAIGAIFEAGVWVGIIIVLVVLGLVGFLFSRFR